MKPIHPRLYTAPFRPGIATPVAATSTSPISRVRSNSVSSSRAYYVNSLSFYDSPSPLPGSRPNQNGVTPTRLAVEVKPEADIHSNTPYSNHHPNNAQSNNHPPGPPPYSLALTSQHSETSSHIPTSHAKPFFPYQSFPQAYYPELAPASSLASDSRTKRQRTRYHLDVGAYGIPKRSRGCCVAGRDGQAKLARADAPRAADDGLGCAVQVGEDAYFVRDNAMGVADGVGGWARVRPGTEQRKSSDPTPSALFARRLMHFCSEEVEAASSSGADLPGVFSDAESDVDPAELYNELEDTLEDLEEGLDVLMILEKAYEKTLQAHTARSADEAEHHSDAPNASASAPDSSSSGPRPTSSRSPSPPRNIPGGSSTALLAVLEHPSQPQQPLKRRSTLFHPQPRHLADAASISDHGAILKIAHLGDCMGMLIRGEEIVWRTEEMWWNFNTPVQLGPSSSTKPRDACIFTLPVQADDILILASDGLSDNLWDEDILDEVVRFRAPYRELPGAGAVTGAFGRNTLAALLSEALCSRARRVSERKDRTESAETEVPFARRAREMGRSFHGGKLDDISVLVAVVSPTPNSPAS